MMDKTNNFNIYVEKKISNKEVDYCQFDIYYEDRRLITCDYNEILTLYTCLKNCIKLKNNIMRDIDDVKYKVVAAYLSQYEPIKKKTDDSVVKTSIDILDEISGVVDISLDEISQIMFDLGYNLVKREDYKIGWLMKEI